jgi:hypothetical protein
LKGDLVDIDDSSCMARTSTICLAQRCLKADRS